MIKQFLKMVKQTGKLTHSTEYYYSAAKQEGKGSSIASICSKAYEGKMTIKKIVKA